MTLIGVISGYHNLKLEKESSYLNTFEYLFDRYKLMRLPFRVALVGYMFQQKSHEI